MNHPFASSRELFPILSKKVQLSSCSQSALATPVRDAIHAFRNRAAVVAEQLGKGWKIKQMNINQGGGGPVPIMRGTRATMLAAEAAPAPIEAGESTITTNVTGQIELDD